MYFIYLKAVLIETIKRSPPLTYLSPPVEKLGYCCLVCFLIAVCQSEKDVWTLEKTYCIHTGEKAYWWEDIDMQEMNSNSEYTQALHMSMNSHIVYKMLLIVFILLKIDFYVVYYIIYYKLILFCSYFETLYFKML